jgi:UDP-2-acetamido-2-deoxy-ribo-hexuluronate aminotransferase
MEMKVDFIDLKAQYRRIKPSIDARMTAVLEHGQFIMGPEVKQLEENLAARVGVKHCIGVASGTDALLIALMALGVGPGDEVVTTPFTFIATAETIALLGAHTVFVDIDPRTYNLDANLLEQAITPTTKVILPVSLYGQCSDMDAIVAIAASHNLAVIEDAAQSFGATYKGRPSCGLSTIGCTSFFPSKPLGCFGDGGACTTNDDGLATLMRQIRVHGQDRRYHHALIGINGRLDTLQAAVLLAKLEIFDEEVVARKRVADEYAKRLGSAVVLPFVETWNTSVFGQYTVSCENRSAVAQILNAAGIPTAIHYPTPLHLQPAFGILGYQAGSFPNAEHAAQHVLSLPMHPYLEAQEISFIGAQVQAATTVGV